MAQCYLVLVSSLQEKRDIDRPGKRVSAEKEN